MKNKISSLFFVLLASIQFVQAQQTQTTPQDSAKNYFEINKNIELFSSVLKQLDMFYVDTLNVQKTVQEGINDMLASIDPYTEYYTEDGTADFKVMTTGEYAGIGASIAMHPYKDGKVAVMIAGPYENMPAAKAGLKVGDMIIEVNGEDVTKVGKKDDAAVANLSSIVSSKLKGQAGTTVKLKIDRPGVKKPLEFSITRQSLHIPAVPYYGMRENHVGYIRLNADQNNVAGFSDGCSLEVKKALLELKLQGATSIILDLRSNGGGILEEAVQIVNLFVPKGKIILSTRGKLRQWDRSYRTTLEPIDTQIPLAILVNSGSASASEITSGSLQDMDRAIIVGTKTFGKGLVQSTRDLPYGNSMKITIAKYYIPSGRCIQAIDYAHRNRDGSVGRIPDSLTSVFKTSVGRLVRDGGGIIPDVKTEPEKTPIILQYLDGKLVISDFITQWAQKHKTIGPIESFAGISDQDYLDFEAFAKAQKFTYEGISEKYMKSLKEAMDYEGYSADALDEYKALEARVTPNVERDLETFKDIIRRYINAEVAERYYYTKGRYIENLKYDKEVKKAVEVLSDTAQYRKLLEAPKAETEAKK